MAELRRRWRRPPPAPPGLNDAEVARYSRQLVLPEWSEAAQLALREASVLVVGAGALGAPVATYSRAQASAASGSSTTPPCALEPPPPDAALHARPGRAEGGERRGEAALPQPRDRRRARPGALRARDARGRRPGGGLLGLLPDALRGQPRLLRRARPARGGRRRRPLGARDGDPAGGERLLPLRVPGATTARGRADLRRGRRARPRRRRDRLAPGARGAEAARGPRRRAARCLPPGRPLRPRVPARGRHAPRDCPDCGPPAR